MFVSTCEKLTGEVKQLFKTCSKIGPLIRIGERV